MRYTFGPFELDTESRRLERGGEPLALPDRHIDILLLLVSRAGQIVSKDTLIEAAWKGLAVTDNSLEQAISHVRRTLGTTASGSPYIETLARRGYRFSQPVTHMVVRHSAEALEALLAPHRAFVEGRAALETLDRDAVVHACGVFDEIVRTSPDYAPAHLGLANALALRFESMRAERGPDRAALARAVHHADEACRLDPSSSEAWAVLGLVCHQSRDHARAVAAAHRAATLDSDNWRHHVRLAYVSWGEDRLRAAHRALKLLPECALAYWLAATVYVARGALAEAEHELVDGAAAQDRQDEGARFGAVGLHLLLGLVRLAAGSEEAALEGFKREIRSEWGAHIYGREACANAWCATAAVHLRRKQIADAATAIDRAIDAVPGHAAALAARYAFDPNPQAAASFQSRLAELHAHGTPVEAAMAEATHRTLTGHPDRAASLLHEVLTRAPADSSGWVVPVDPLLHVRAQPELWAPVLALLRSRAA